jgi:hypothetical protein
VRPYDPRQFSVWLFTRKSRNMVTTGLFISIFMAGVGGDYLLKLANAVRQYLWPKFIS